ncbi:MAG: hypothetical protein C0171_00905 [Caldisphaera sp.]|jgi:uncharacterized protein (UPF0248 family)|uniref:DUF504 domain-containing protein n=1 Tax=Caldisphaera sp. TaxID=2060322 RepID=UPI000CAFB6CD|nr:RNA repair domain-containing protein [Caldisphaera sp.]PMP60008.1 MAG: hypothetical protein C0201_03890 [Caldisphaera sp.]PMP92361.1 MAG: hypothetical protein C0171_00905 [Caldisphaera sp.]
MSKKRSTIKNIIGKAINSFDKREEYIIIYIDRTPEHGNRLLQLSTNDIIAVSNWAITLSDNETVIPIHRIVEIRKKDGKVLWKRGFNNGR